MVDSLLMNAEGDHIQLSISLETNRVKKKATDNRQLIRATYQS